MYVVAGEVSREQDEPRRKVIRVESEGDAGLCWRIIELEPGGSRRYQFRAKRAQRSTRTYVLVRQSLQ